MHSLSRSQIQELDRRATTEYGIPSLLLMENAGRGTADLFCALIRKEELTFTQFLVLAGKGNNGGDGFVMARHLWNRGFQVQVLLLADPKELKGDTLTNWQILEKMKIPVKTSQILLHLNDAIASSIVIDAIFGTGLTKPIAGPVLDIIRLVNQSGRPVLSLDLPSGMDADTGEPLPECIHATWTATMGAPKKGFNHSEAFSSLGQVFVMDIGWPKELIKDQRQKTED